MGAVDGVEDGLDGLGRCRDGFLDGRATRYAEGVEVGGARRGEIVVAVAPLFARRFAIGKLQTRFYAQWEMRAGVGPKLGIEKPLSQIVAAVRIEADNGLSVKSIRRADDRRRGRFAASRCGNFVL